MNTLLRVTVIGAALLALSGLPVAQADQSRHYRGYDRPMPEKHMRHHERRWQGRQERRHHANSRHARRHYDRHYGHQHRRHDYGHKHGHRHASRHYHEGYGYRHHRHVAPGHLIVERRRHAHHVIIPELPVVVGGVIGSAIANDMSHGDPAATVGGAVIGAVIGGALTY